MMYGTRKSDGPILPEKQPNKFEQGCANAEAVEGRGSAKRNTDQQNVPRTPSRTSGAPSALDRVREAERFDVRTQGRSPVR
jgi:RNA-directed DNA polymerase